MSTLFLWLSRPVSRHHRIADAGLDAEWQAIREHGEVAGMGISRFVIERCAVRAAESPPNPDAGAPERIGTMGAGGGNEAWDGIVGEARDRALRQEGV